MNNEKLVEYIKSSLAKGTSIDQINQQLQTSGWPQKSIDQAIQQINYPQQSQSTPATRIKIVALWLFIVGFVGILLSLFSMIGALLLFQLLATGSFFLLINIASSFIISIILIFLSILLFKIRSGLNKLEFEAYQAALLFFASIEVASLLSIPFFYLLLKQSEVLIFAPIGLVVNGVFLYLLYSQKSLFINNTARSVKRKTIVALILLFLAIPFSIYAQSLTKNLQEKQMKDTLRKAAQKNREKNPEPVTNNWQPYMNNEFNFSLELPVDWRNKEYIPKFGQGKRIAFSPKELPDYWNPDDPYFFVIVFPVSDQPQYSLFQARLSGVKTNPAIHKEAFLGGIKGEETSGSFSAEYKGYVYELTLHMTQTDSGDFEYSEISKHILTSFKFTN